MERAVLARRAVAGGPVMGIPTTIQGARVIRDLGTSGRNHARYCLLECPICKGVRRVRVAHAKSGKVRCRNCWAKSLKTHGLTGARVYRIWNTMLQRCEDANSVGYRYYGGAGVTVCKSWRSAEAFCIWALANGYRDDLTIDRIDNDGDYEPANCRWTTRNVQARNGRRIRATNTSGYRGVSYCKQTRRWRAQIHLGGRTFHLGRFDGARDAAREYDAYVIRHGLEHTINGVLWLVGVV